MSRAIQNFETLATDALRLDALSLAEAGYAAINTGAALVREVHIEGDELHIGDTVHRLGERRVFFVGIGKCSVAAAHAIERIFGERLTGGIVLDVADTKQEQLSKIEVHIGTHPLPTEANEQATRHIIELLSGCTEDDLVLMLVSGGGSTLLCLPQTPMTYLTESSLFTELTDRGATIQEINTVRKHTSLARGGGLAKAACPAEVVSLIISDVPGNDIEYISSGPTVRDDSTVEDARAVLEKYRVPAGETVFVETAKGEEYFARVTNTLFVTNQTALRAIQHEAQARGYAATILSDHIEGEARDIANQVAEALHAAPAKSVLLYAGECTVTLGEHPGRGGRCQEMALAALHDIRDGEAMLPFASDGRDSSDHAGAIADATTLAHVQEHNLSIEESLAAHCSYDFFTTSGDALVTGYTESNVSDIIIAIKK